MRVNCTYKQRHAIWQKKYISIVLPFFILFNFWILSVIPFTNNLSPFSGKASAATSNTLNFQGRLLTNTGGLVADGSYNIEFNLYTVPSGGTSEWTETRLNSAVQGVTVKNGYFSVYLGDTTSFPGTIDWDQEHWLGMTVRGTGSCAFGACTPTDSEMTPRFKLSAVPYAFRAGAITDSSGNAYTGDDLIQKSPSSIQGLNSALAAIRLNQTGSGTLLQLQGNGVDVFTLDKNGNVATSGGVTLGNNTGTTSGTLRWTGTDFEGYDGLSWVSLTSGGGGGSDTTDANFVSSVANLPATASGTATGLLTFTTATAVSSVAGSNTFIAPADGSFRACMVVGNANRTAGSATLRWRVNGVSVGAGVCVIDGTNVRTSAGVQDSGVVTFLAGDTIGVVFDSTGFAPLNPEMTVYWSVDYNSAAAASNAFIQDGNAFGGTATLGTTDAFGLQIITNNTPALSISSAGDSTFAESLTVQNGGINVTGNSTVTGTLDGITGLTVVSGGASISGGLDNNNGGITEAGSISGVNGSISSIAGLTITSASGGDIILDSASGIVALTGSTLRRTASGTTGIELNDGFDTTLSILNTNGLAVANLAVEGSVSGLIFIGSGSSLTDLDADNITSGTLSDSRLSSNVALLNSPQTFTDLNTFSAGLVVGNTGSATSGAIRFNGSDFEGYDGSQWLSLTSGGGGGGNVTTVVKTANEIVNNSSTLQNDDELSFPVGGNEVWSFRFVVQGNSGVTPGFKFAVTAPSGAVCRVAFTESENATSESQLGCGAASTLLSGTGANELYEITGTITNGVNTGNVTLQWAQFTADPSNTTVYAGSFVNAFPESIYIAPPSSVFVQGGNTFGATAVIGTGDANGLQIITDGVARLSILSTGEATFSSGITMNASLDVLGTTVLGGDVTLGDSITDGLTIVGNSVTITNGLNFDSNTFVIDAASNFIGINNGSPTNTLTINTASATDSSAQGFIATGGVGNKGLVIQGVGSQSANLFELQNNSGLTLAGFNSSGGLVLGLSTLTSSATISRSIALPDASGTVCLSSSSLCGYIQFAVGSFQTDATTSDSIAINKTGVSGNLLALQKNGVAVFTVANNGSLQIQSTDTVALDVRNVGGSSFFSVDTSTGTIRIGSSTPDAVGVLFVLDTKNTSGDPTGVDGGMYYNSVLGRNRCYENGRWTDCTPTRMQDDVVLGVAGATIDVAVPDGVTSLICRLESPGVTTANLIYLRFNGVSSGNPYTYNTLLNTTGANNNTSTVSSAGANQIAISGTTTLDGSSTFDVNISNFGAFNKSVNWLGTREASGIPQRLNGSGSFINTSGVITSVQFVTSAGNFAAGSRAWCEAR